MIGIGAGIVLLFVGFVGGWHGALILPVRPIIVNEFIDPPKCDIAQIEKTQLDAYFNIRNGEDCGECPLQSEPVCPICKTCQTCETCDESLAFVTYENGLNDGWKDCVDLYNMNNETCKDEYHGLRDLRIYRGSKR